MKKDSYDSEILQAALSYAARGWPVIPLHTTTEGGCSCGRKDCTSPGKHPRTKNGVKDATTDEGVIRGWWGNWPEANIGVATGAVSGLVVLDVDSQEAEAFIQSKGMPHTPQVKTGKGTHHYLRHPGGTISNRVDSEIRLDVRADNAYVVAPPSLHQSGKRYEWSPSLSPEDTNPAKLLPWMLEHLAGDKNKQSGKAHGWQATALQGVSMGSRNDTATSLTGRYVAMGLSDYEIERFLLSWNQRNTPPLPTREILRVIGSVRATHERNHGNHPESDTDSSNGNKNKKKRESHADVLIRIGLGPNVQLFHNQGGRTFASVKHEGGRAIWPLASRNFKDFLTARFFSEKRSAPSKDALRQALPVLEGVAKFEREQIKLSNRVAWHNDVIHYDVADRMGRIVRVSPGSWEILGEHIDEDLPILFRRYDHQEPQRLPDSYSPDLELLLKYLHLRDDDQKYLLLIYIISCFIPEIPHPIMVIHGPQGAAKSTTTKLVRRLIDPSVNDLQTLTRKNDQTVHALAQNWFCAFDNISYIDEETSDALCRASTGGTLARRQLYTDEDTITFELQTCVSLNGINVAVPKADLMDRALLFESARIPESERKEVKQLLEEFDRDRPRILAGIFSVLAKAMQIEPDLQRKRLPRMADFARWGRAISEALGSGDEVFLRLCQDNISQQHEEIVSANPVGTALLALMSNETEWDGRISDLLSELEGLCEDLGIDRRSRFWPGAPHILTKRLKELEATLAGVGILVELKRSNRGKTVSITKSDGTGYQVASLTTNENHSDNESSDASDATFLPRERDIFNIPSFSVGPQKKEREGGINVLPRSPGSCTSVTSVTPEHAEPCLGIPSEERPNPETCNGCQHFKPDPLWPRCELVKGNRNVSHLEQCPLGDGLKTQ